MIFGRRSFVAFSLFLSVTAGASAHAQKRPDVRLDVGSPPGGAYSSYPVIAAAGSAVYAAWNDRRNDPTPTASLQRNDVYFNRSLDGGATWLASDVRLDLGSAPGASDSYWVRIVCSGSHVFVVWNDNRNGVYEVYANVSLDGGTTWLSSDVPVSADAVVGGDVVVAANGDELFVVWPDWRHGTTSTADVYFNRSIDGGLSWLPADVRLDVGKPVASSNSYDVHVVASSSTVCAVWHDLRSNPSAIYANRSLDGGMTWLPTDVLVDTGPQKNSSFSEVALDGSDVYVVWGERQPFPQLQTDIFFNRSTDGGAAWLPSSKQVNVRLPGLAPTYADLPALAVDGTAVYVAWQDNCAGGQVTNPPNIAFNRSLDGGDTWLPANACINSHAPATAFNEPVIAASGASVYVAFRGASGIYLNRSLDAGLSWLATDVRLDSNGLQPLLPEIVSAGSSLYSVWMDPRNGLHDVYFDLALGAQTYGAGSPGSGGIVPTIAASGSASIGSTLSIDLANGLGGAEGVLYAGTLGPASIRVDGGILLVQPPVQRMLVRLGGKQGVPGAGSASLAFPIPDDLSLIGTRLNFQARFTDPGAARPLPGAPRGVSLTGGLEVWIL